MTKEAFKKAKKLEGEISHISKVIEFIEQKKELRDEKTNKTNMFIINDNDDYEDLTLAELDCIYVALVNKRFILQQDFNEL
jgi:hypothetical protein